MNAWCSDERLSGGLDGMCHTEWIDRTSLQPSPFLLNETTLPSVSPSQWWPAIHNVLSHLFRWRLIQASAGRRRTAVGGKQDNGLPSSTQWADLSGGLFSPLLSRSRLQVPAPADAAMWGVDRPPPWETRTPAAAHRSLQCSPPTGCGEYNHLICGQD